MAEVSSSNSNYVTSRRESFTLWMKSLVFHGKGCTVFDSNGKLVYRIDNYDGKSSCKEVDLLDIKGKVLFSLRQKVLDYYDLCYFSPKLHICCLCIFVLIIFLSNELF